jgi:hypothetical protein
MQNLGFDYPERHVLQNALSIYAGNQRYPEHRVMALALLERLAKTRCSPWGCDYCSPEPLYDDSQEG